jgi:hypothetical protein
MTGDKQAAGAEDQLDVIFRIAAQGASEGRDELAMFEKTVDLRATRVLVDQVIEPIMKIPHPATERIGGDELWHVRTLPEIRQYMLFGLATAQRIAKALSPFH